MASVKGYLPNGRRAALSESLQYCNGYPVNWFCEDCGWEGARLTGSIRYSHYNRINDPIHGPTCNGSHARKEGTCGVCGKETTVWWPWRYGFPTMTNYLWGPDFILKEA